MQHIEHTNLVWIDSSTPNIKKANITNNAEGGGVSLWTVPKQSGFKHHSHKGYEYIYT